MNKSIIIIFLLTLKSMISIASEEVSLSFTENSKEHWQYISDRTMGGISDGNAVLDQEGGLFFARLTGNVSTKNNGGFIQLRTRFSFANLQTDNKKIKGVRLNVRGNGEVYHVFIRTDKTNSYNDFYLSSFKTKSKWEIINLPFNKFKHRFLNNSSLAGNNVKSLGIVAYGRNFISDISVSKIIFYY